MKVLVDSNIWIDIFKTDSVFFDWSSDKLLEISKTRSISINPIIYAEISIHFPSHELLDKRLNLIEHERLILSYAAGFLAGKVFQTYRKRGGAKTSVLSDFYIGAHAQVDNMSLLTRDPKPYRTYFPKVKLICPP
jgi:predicted nucleic acid-binding protein